jgi:hypothetical protein
MRYFAFAALAFGALCAAPGFAQTHPSKSGAAAENNAAAAVQVQQSNQQMYNQGQAAIQSGVQGHAQSQQTLSTLSQRNQALLDAQAPKPH